MALALTVRLDALSVRPHEVARAQLAIVLEAALEERPRAPARTVLVLDVSGSMAGEPLEQVVRSVDRLLDALSPNDEIGVVAFSDEAASIAEPVRVDAAGKRLVRSRVARLAASGNTNVEAGLELAVSQVRGAPAGSRRGVILLSDGAPNRGAHTAEGLRTVVRRHRRAASFFCLGYGQDHCEDVLAAIGSTGGGGYEVVPDPALCARAFARALGAQADVVASGIELRVAPAEGVEIVRFVGDEHAGVSCEGVSREGVVVALPDMLAGGRRVVVAEIVVRAPSGEKRFAPIADVSAGGQTATLGVEIADRAPAFDPLVLADVFLVRADRVRHEARALADRGHWSAAASALRRQLAAIAACPGFVAGDGSPLAEAYELLVDEATVMERKPPPDEYAAFRKGAVASELAVRSPETARSRGDASSRLVEKAAGDFPDAWLVAVDAGARHLLRAETIIGRTSTADVVVARKGVARRHAEIHAVDGRFFVRDLASTCATTVNGVRLGRAPHALRAGDVLRIGDAELRYEETPTSSSPAC